MRPARKAAQAPRILDGANSPTNGKPKLWKRLTATPLSTMVVVAFPLAALCLGLSVTALVGQLQELNRPPQLTTDARGPASAELKIPTPEVPTPAEPEELPTPEPVELPADPPQEVLPPEPPAVEETPEPIETPTPEPTPSVLPTPPLATPPAIPSATAAPTAPQATLSATPSATTPTDGANGKVSTPTPPTPTPVPAAVEITNVDVGKGDAKGRLVPIVSGTAAKGTVILINTGAKTTVQVVSDSRGQWRSEPLVDVLAGITTLNLSATAPDGTTSWTWHTLELSAPSVLISPMETGGFSLSISDRPGTYFEVLLNGQPFSAPVAIGPTGSWKGPIATLRPGTHRIGVRIVIDGRPGPLVTTVVRVF